MSNPTCEKLEQTVAALERGTAAVATASGQAAIHVALEALLQPGDNFIASSRLFGGTVALFGGKFAKVGYEVRWADPTDPKSVADKINDRTRFIFAESISNPDGAVTNFGGLAALAERHKIPFIVDNTLATPFLCRPLEHGAHIVIHSATKFLDGHGNALAGLIVDGGRFPWVMTLVSLLM